MTEIIRTAEKGEESALRALWRDIFEDEEEVIDYFFKSQYKQENTAVALCGGRPVSMGFILPTGLLKIPEAESVPCAMIYGLATDKAHRGRGYAGNVARKLMEIARAGGYSHVVLHPANDGLFGYYENVLDFKSIFFAEETEYTINAADALPGNIETAVQTLEGYCAARERMLENTAHIAFNSQLIEMQAFLCAQCGGGLYSFYDGGELTGCAIVEISDGAVHVKELLAAPEMQRQICGEIAARHRVKSVLIRRPVSPDSAQSDIKPFGMIHGAALDTKACSAWYGPAFD